MDAYLVGRAGIDEFCCVASDRVRNHSSNKRLSKRFSESLAI